MFLIVGLGNPGKEYAKTFHNVGFMVLDELCRRNDVEIRKKKGNSLIFEGNLFGEKIILAKPQTYMNNSGIAVSELKNSFKPDNILIIYDDVDLPLSTFRFRESGSAGTHNGMRSVVSVLNTQEIQRLRIGIKPERQIFNLADYVLSKGNVEEQEKLDESIDKAVDFLEMHIKNKFIKKC